MRGSESSTMTLRLGREEKQRVWMEKELVGSRRLSEEEKLMWDEEEQAFAMDITMLTDEGIASLGKMVSMELTEEVSFLPQNNLDLIPGKFKIRF